MRKSCLGWWEEMLVQSVCSLAAWYLGLGEVELSGELGPLAAHHVLAALELHLQPVELLRGEGRACPLGPIQVQALGQDDLSDGPLGIWGMGDVSLQNPSVALHPLVEAGFGDTVATSLQSGGVRVGVRVHLGSED